MASTPGEPERAAGSRVVQSLERGGPEGGL